MVEKSDSIDPRFKSNWKVLTGQQAWLKEYAEGVRTYPICIEIDPANSCPLNCEHCCWGDMRAEHKSSIPETKLLSLVQEVADLGTKAVIWTGGGDPLANPATPTAIHKAASLGVENAMFTNGILLTPEKTEIMRHGLNWVRFNMAGDNPEAYATVHRVPERLFDLACTNINHFCQVTKGEVDTGIGTAVNPGNFDGLKQLPYLARELGVGFFQAKLDFNLIGSEEYLQWWNETVIPYFTEAKEKLGGGVRVFADPVVRTTEADYCHAHRIITAITADGRVAFCKMRRDQEQTSLGNINDQPLAEIFDSNRHIFLSESIQPKACPILKNFCPYRTTNEAVAAFLENQNYPIPAEAIFEDRHKNFF